MARLKVSLDMIAAMLGLPDGWSVRGVYPDGPITASVRGDFLVESPEFPELPEGGALPDLVAMFEGGPGAHRLAEWRLT